MIDKIRGIDLKKIIKIATILFGFSLIVFISFYNATFDFSHFNWGEWGANSSILVGIMIFGILMGNSTGTDIQKEKNGGRYQNACNDYVVAFTAVEQIKMFFSQWWLQYKDKKLEEKKIDYLVDNEFDSRVATAIVKNIDKDDLEIGKLQIDPLRPHENIYVKNEVKFKKLNAEQIEILKNIFGIKLHTFGESYYLSLFDEGLGKTNEAEKGVAIANKIKRDKANSFILKISSSLVISIVWSALTINDFVSGGGDGAVRKAWMNLLSRISALITSYVSGFSTSVINVRDEASAIENKTSILKEYKQCYDTKIFIPETYEQMIEREFNEQKEWEKKHTVEVEVVSGSDESSNVETETTQEVENGIALIPQKE